MNYKLSEDAQADIIRIHQWGVRVPGEARTDECFNTFFDHFELLATQPTLYPAVEHIHEGY